MMAKNVYNIYVFLALVCLTKHVNAICGCNDDKPTASPADQGTNDNDTDNTRSSQESARQQPGGLEARATSISSANSGHLAATDRAVLPSPEPAAEVGIRTPIVRAAVPTLVIPIPERDVLYTDARPAAVSQPAPRPAAISRPVAADARAAVSGHEPEPAGRPAVHRTMPSQRRAASAISAPRRELSSSAFRNAAESALRVEEQALSQNLRGSLTTRRGRRAHARRDAVAMVPDGVAVADEVREFSAVPAENVAQLLAMGFDEVAADDALRRVDGNVEAAVEILFAGPEIHAAAAGDAEPEQQPETIVVQREELAPAGVQAARVDAQAADDELEQQPARCLMNHNPQSLVASPGPFGEQLAVDCLQPLDNVSRADFFESIANVYNYNFFRDVQLRAAVKEIYLDETTFNAFDKKTTLFIPKRLISADISAETVALIELNLKARIPIYFGGSRKAELLSVARMQKLVEFHFPEETVRKQIFGKDYETLHGDDMLRTLQKTVDKQYAAEEQIRFAISGPATMLGDTPTTAGGEFLSEYIYTTHVWGINLEGRNTADYHKFLDNGRLKRDQYQTTFREILRLTFAAAAQAAAQEGKKISLRMPKVSLGEFLNQVRVPDDRQFAHNVFYEAVYEFAEEYAAKDVEVVLCLLEIDLVNALETRRSLVNALGIFDDAQIGHLVAGFASDHKGFSPTAELGFEGRGTLITFENDLFRLSPGTEGFPYTDKVTMFTNAWDSNSFVGNAGSKDPTLDGYLVAGWRYGAPAANTSFLQQPAFCQYRDASSGRWGYVANDSTDVAFPFAGAVDVVAAGVLPAAAIPGDILPSAAADGVPVPAAHHAAVAPEPEDPGMGDVVSREANADDLLTEEKYLKIGNKNALASEYTEYIELNRRAPLFLASVGEGERFVVNGIVMRRLRSEIISSVAAEDDRKLVITFRVIHHPTRRITRDADIIALEYPLSGDGFVLSSGGLADPALVVNEEITSLVFRPCLGAFAVESRNLFRKHLLEKFGPAQQMEALDAQALKEYLEAHFSLGNGAQLTSADRTFEILLPKDAFERDFPIADECRNAKRSVDTSFCPNDKFPNPPADKVRFLARVGAPIPAGEFAGKKPLIFQEYKSFVAGQAHDKFSMIVTKVDSIVKIVSVFEHCPSLATDADMGDEPKDALSDRHKFVINAALDAAAKHASLNIPENADHPGNTINDGSVNAELIMMYRNAGEVFQLFTSNFLWEKYAKQNSPDATTRVRYSPAVKRRAIFGADDIDIGGLSRDFITRVRAEAIKGSLLSDQCKQEVQYWASKDDLSLTTSEKQIFDGIGSFMSYLSRPVKVSDSKFTPVGEVPRSLFNIIFMLNPQVGAVPTEQVAHNFMGTGGDAADYYRSHYLTKDVGLGFVCEASKRVILGRFATGVAEAVAAAEPEAEAVDFERVNNVALTMRAAVLLFEEQYRQEVYDMEQEEHKSARANHYSARIARTFYFDNRENAVISRAEILSMFPVDDSLVNFVLKDMHIETGVEEINSLDEGFFERHGLVGEDGTAISDAEEFLGEDGNPWACETRRKLLPIILAFAIATDKSRNALPLLRIASSIQSSLSLGSRSAGHGPFLNGDNRQIRWINAKLQMLGLRNQMAVADAARANDAVTITHQNLFASEKKIRATVNVQSLFAIAASKSVFGRNGNGDFFQDIGIFSDKECTDRQFFGGNPAFAHKYRWAMGIAALLTLYASGANTVVMFLGKMENGDSPDRTFYQHRYHVIAERGISSDSFMVTFVNSIEEKSYMRPLTQAEIADHETDLSAEGRLELLDKVSTAKGEFLNAYSKKVCGELRADLIIEAISRSGLLPANYTPAQQHLIDWIKHDDRTPDELKQFLTFVTGSASVTPSTSIRLDTVGGGGHGGGVQGSPAAHTCFNSIDLPHTLADYNKDPMQWWA